MEKYKSSLKNLAHIFLDSMGWETYFTAFVDAVDITPIESQIQAQGVPIRFELYRGFLVSAPYTGQNNTVYFQLRIDGAAHVRAPEGYSNIRFRAHTFDSSAYPWSTTFAFARDLAVQVACSSAAEAQYMIKYYRYGTAANPGPYVWFEVSDRPTGFIYSTIKRKYYQWFVKNEKIAHTPSLVGLKRMLQNLGVRNIGVETGHADARTNRFVARKNPNTGKMETTEILEQFTRNGAQPMKAGYHTINTCNVVRFSTLLDTGDYGLIELRLTDVQTQTDVEYYYLDMHKLNIRRGDRQILGGTIDVVEQIYTIQGADKNLVMFDPSDNQIWQKTIVSINRDNLSGFTTENTAYVWDTDKLPDDDARKIAGIRSPYQIDDGVTLDAMGDNNLTVETDNSLPEDDNHWLDWNPGVLFTNLNIRGYTYPPPKDQRPGHTQRVILINSSGGLSEGKLYRDRFILSEYVADDDYRALQGISWNSINLNILHTQTPPDDVWPYTTSEYIQKFINWYLKEYCNHKMVLIGDEDTPPYNISK